MTVGIGSERRGGRYRPGHALKNASGLVMPSANNQGIRIRYELAGEGPPLVLHHQALGSLVDRRDLTIWAP
jgi:hypothetical protein